MSQPPMMADQFMPGCWVAVRVPRHWTLRALSWPARLFSRRASEWLRFRLAYGYVSHVKRPPITVNWMENCPEEKPCPPQ